MRARVRVAAGDDADYFCDETAWSREDLNLFNGGVCSNHSLGCGLRKAPFLHTRRTIHGAASNFKPAYRDIPPETLCGHFLFIAAVSISWQLLSVAAIKKMAT